MTDKKRSVWALLHTLHPKPKSIHKDMINIITEDGNVRSKDELLKDFIVLTFINHSKDTLAGVLFCKILIQAAAIHGYMTEAAFMHEQLSESPVYKTMLKDAQRENYRQLLDDDPEKEYSTTTNHFIIP